MTGYRRLRLVAARQKPRWPLWKICELVVYALLLCGLALLAGCGTVRTVTLPPQVVNVPIGISCLPATLPLRPRTYSDAELLTLDDYKFVEALWWNSEKLGGYTRELEAILNACR